MATGMNDTRDTAIDMDGGTEAITIRVKDEAGVETFFLMRASQKMESLFRAYAQRKSVPVRALRFELEGTVITGDQTPQALHLTDGIHIDCIQVEVADKRSAALTISVNGQPGQELFFRVMPTTKMYRVFREYALRNSLSLRALCFLWRGLRICGDDTPSLLELRDGSKIECTLDPSLLAMAMELYAHNVHDIMLLIVKDQAGGMTYFKVEPSTKMAKVFSSYARRMGVRAAALRFVYNGSPVSGDQTAKTLKLKDGDTIHCNLGNAKASFSMRANKVGLGFE